MTMKSQGHGPQLNGQGPASHPMLAAPGSAEARPGAGETKIPARARLLVAIGLGVAVAVGSNLASISDSIVGSQPPSGVAMQQPAPSAFPSASGSQEVKDEGRHYTGIYMRTLNPQVASRLPTTARTEGVLVLNVFPTSPADQAGIRPGDIYLALDGVPVRDRREISAKNQLTAVGQGYTVTLERNGMVQNISVRVAEVTAEYRAWVAGQHFPTQ